MKRFFLFIGLTALAYFVINNAGTFKNSMDLKTKLIPVDTSEITKIVLFPRKNGVDETILTKTETGWIASKNIQNIRASKEKIEQTLKDIAQAKILRVVGQSKKKWAKYGLNEVNAQRVQLFSNGQKIIDLVMGNAQPGQDNPSQWVSYVRYHEGEEVYEVDTHLGITLRQPFEGYRNNVIFNIPVNSIEKVSLIEEDSTFTITQNNGSYFLNGDILLDSNRVQQYFRGIPNYHTNNTKTTYIYGFDEVEQEDKLLKTLNIHCTNIAEPVKIYVYADSIRVPPFIIHSSLNKDTYFSSDSSGLFQKIFPSFSDFEAKN